MSDSTTEEVALCVECGDHHEGECPTVQCCDCGCTHIGTEDKCYCNDGYCHECECDNTSACEHCSGWHSNEHDCCDCGLECEKQWMGCDACQWKYETSGYADSCGGDGPGYINEDCAYAPDFYEAQVPAEDIFFSVVRPENVVEDPEQVTARDQYRVGEQLGLSRDIDLSMAVADFYILERLYDDLHDRTSTYDAVRGRFTLGGLRPPAEFGSDSKLERLAYDVANTRNSMNSELARQFKTYLIMAVGGELRHAPSRAWREERRRGTPKRLWPKSPDRSPWKWFGIGPNTHARHRKFGCPCCVEAKRTGIFGPTVLPCSRAHLKDDGSVVIRPSTQANPSCGYFPWWADTHGISTGREMRRSYSPDSEITKSFFENLEPNSNDEGRGLAWKQWARMYTTHGPRLLKECVQVFKKWTWASGFGGQKWGDVAEFTMLYARGEMSDSAFIDRAWTLEHNGGCVFNKFWMRGVAKLKVVLDIQADDERHYPKLRKHASQYVRGLLSQYEALTGGEPRAMKIYVNA